MASSSWGQGPLNFESSDNDSESDESDSESGEYGFDDESESETVTLRSVILNLIQEVRIDLQINELFRILP